MTAYSISFFRFLILVFGLVIGSFLNCVIYRLRIGKSFLKGHSYCPHCKHRLSWQDLVPIVSFLILKGNCRYCRKKISLQYPLVEAATGFVFLLVFIFLFPDLDRFSTFNLISLVYYWLTSCFLIIIFAYDLKHYLIPDKIVYPAVLITLFYNYFYLKPLFFNSLYSALGASAFLGAIFLVSQGRWIGLGDVKFVFLMGLLLGSPNIFLGMFSSFFLGAIVGMWLLFSGKKRLKSKIPFGPFLVTGTFLALFFGKELISWYLTQFL